MFLNLQDLRSLTDYKEPADPRRRPNECGYQYETRVDGRKDKTFISPVAAITWRPLAPVRSAMAWGDLKARQNGMAS